MCSPNARSDHEETTITILSTELHKKRKKPKAGEATRKESESSKARSDTPDPYTRPPKTTPVRLLQLFQKSLFVKSEKKVALTRTSTANHKRSAMIAVSWDHDNTHVVSFPDRQPSCNTFLLHARACSTKTQNTPFKKEHINIREKQKDKLYQLQTRNRRK